MECFNGHQANENANCSNPTCVYRASNRHTPVASPPETRTTNDSENWWDNDHDRAET